MIETREKEINGNVYSVTQLPARRALRLQYKLMKIFSPAIPYILQISGEGKDTNIIVSTDNLAEACIQLFSQMDEKTYESMIYEMIQGVRRNNIEMTLSTIDIDFAGDLVSLMKVIYFVLEVNFENFFGVNGIGLLSKQEVME